MAEKKRPFQGAVENFGKKITRGLKARKIMGTKGRNAQLARNKKIGKRDHKAQTIDAIKRVGEYKHAVRQKAKKFNP